MKREREEEGDVWQNEKARDGRVSLLASFFFSHILVSFSHQYSINYLSSFSKSILPSHPIPILRSPPNNPTSQSLKALPTSPKSPVFAGVTNTGSLFEFRLVSGQVCLMNAPITVTLWQREGKGSGAEEVRGERKRNDSRIDR